MFSVPAHKQTDPSKLPGQRVNPVPGAQTDQERGKDKACASGHRRNVYTLADYVEQITAPPQQARSVFHAVALALVQGVYPRDQEAA
jgi:hypothetical protein